MFRAPRLIDSHSRRRLSSGAGTNRQRITRRVICLIGLAFATGGCDSVSKLRDLFHGSAAPEGEAGFAGLRVEVEPNEGIVIRLDDEILSRTAPFESRQLQAGPRNLTVEAKGYHAFSIPVLLRNHELLDVPISLRRRTPEPLQPQRRKVQTPSPPSPPKNSGAPLPSTIAPIPLTLAAQPPGRFTLDRGALKDKTAVLNRVSGWLGVDDLQLEYEIGRNGLLDLRIPESATGSWTRDGKPAAPGTRFPLHHGTVRIERRSDDGTTRVFFLRR